MIYHLFHDYAQNALTPAIISTVITGITLIAYLWIAGSSIRTSAAGGASWLARIIRLLNIMAISSTIVSWYALLLGDSAIRFAMTQQQSGIIEDLVAPDIFDQQRILLFGTLMALAVVMVNGAVYWHTRRGSRFRLWLDRFRGIRREQEAHGSAHFATRQEFKRFRSDQQSGVNFYGKFMGTRRGSKFTYLGDKFCLTAEDAARGIITIGNPGSGKSSSVILPVLFDSMRLRQNLVVADPQLELTKQIIRYSAVTGHRVIVHDPTNPKTPRYNIAASVNSVADARAVAEVLVPKNSGGGDDFWSKAAESLLAACLIRFDNVGQIFESFVDLRKLGERLNEQPDDAQRLAASFIASATGDGKLANNIVATLQQSLTGWADSTIRESTAANDFSADMLVDCGKPTVLILACPGKYRRTVAPYLGAVLTKILLDLDSIGEQTEDGTLPIPIKFVIDEFPALGDLSAIVEFANLVRKRRIAFLLALQTMGQLENIYGRNSSETLLAGMAFQIIFGGGDQATAKHYSQVAGRGTETETDKTTGYTSSRSRDLLTPDEIVRPPQGNCTIFGRYVTSEYATYVIVLARLTRIYERADVRRLVKHADKRKLQVVPRGGLPDITPKSEKKRRKTPIRMPTIPSQPQKAAQSLVPVVVKPCISKEEWASR
jgi:type IV secretory pathway TraG/TraD family ATPase VirD4